jgi:hypothetical protein
MPLRVKKSESFNLRMMVQWGREHFEINPEYQRSKMWTDRKKQLLLDSIIKGLPIGTFILKKKDDGKFEVLDGQQRIDAIFCFVEGHLLTPTETTGFIGKNHENLLTDLRRSAEFDSFEIFYDEIEDGTDQDIAMIFLRLQEGMPLNSAERLNATIGAMRNFVFEVSKHPVFSRDTKISPFRFAHRIIAAHMTLLELASNFDNVPYPEFPNLRFPNLRKMYTDNVDTIPPRLHRRIIGTLDLIHQMLGEDGRVIRKKSDLPIVYLLTSYLRDKYVFNFQLLGNFIIRFFTTVAQVKVPDGEIPRNQYERYVELRKKGLTHDTFCERFRIILGLFLNEVPKIAPKDPKRSFEVGQKLAIYYNKNNRICQYCHEVVEWKDADFHHIIFHSNGGPTTVENGQLIHINCHRKFHEEKGKDV